MALFLAIMTFLTALQVVLRYVFNSGLIWSLEATTYSFAWLVLLGMSYGVRTRSHIAVDLLVSRLENRKLRFVSYLCLLVCVAYALSMLYGGAIFVMRLLELGHDARDLPIARWILTIMLPLGFALLTLRFLELGWSLFKGKIERFEFGQHNESSLSVDQLDGDKMADK